MEASAAILDRSRKGSNIREHSPALLPGDQLEDHLPSSGSTLRHQRAPRVLLVTPEISYLPEGMGRMAPRISVKAGGLADVSASLVSALFEMGADIHVALPNYRRLFHIEPANLGEKEFRNYVSDVPDHRIHLAEDRAFYYREKIYGDRGNSDLTAALAFQREVINNIIPRVQPDLIHCSDWMTGLIPGMARRLGIPSLFTLHNVHSEQVSLQGLEDQGIDGASFWKNLYYSRNPYSYEESRSSNPVDLLCSGLFAAHIVNTVSPTFLDEIVEGWHAFIPDSVRQELMNKRTMGYARGILNAPDRSYNPATDPHLAANYGTSNLCARKRSNKLEFQRRMGLVEDEWAPVFFWPSRLDPMQKGPQLLAEILHRTVEEYRGENFQIALVADGPFQDHFRSIVYQCHLHDRVAVANFDESLSRLGFAASDFTLVPSSFEPCGLPQMIGQLYGSLPIVHDTGGLHDTVQHLDRENDTGNGFVFGNHDANGLRWAIDRAMEFYRFENMEDTLVRVMHQASLAFNHETTTLGYIELYEETLQRSLCPSFG